MGQVPDGCITECCTTTRNDEGRLQKYWESAQMWLLAVLMRVPSEILAVVVFVFLAWASHELIDFNFSS